MELELQLEAMDERKEVLVDLAQSALDELALMGAAIEEMLNEVRQRAL